MIQDLKNELSIILARTGVFFAKCDHDYDIKEKSFIKNFLSDFSSQNFITGDVSDIIKKIEKENISIKDIANQTLSFSSKLEKDEVEPFKQEMTHFIEKMIAADGKVVPEEEANFKVWKQIVL